MAAQRVPGMPAGRGALNRGAGAMAAWHTVRVAGAAFGRNRDPIRVGLVGCGGRGRGAAEQVLLADDGVELVALADVSAVAIDTAYNVLADPQRRRGPLPGFKVTRERCFLGLDAYRRLIDTDIDLVLLATPPGFRPEHAEYAVRSDKHVFAEKPGATDPAGIRRLLALEALVRQGGRSFVAGFQRRHSPPVMEAVERIQAGHIGDITAAWAFGNGSSVWYRDRPPDMTDRDFWLYNWYHVDWLSGDHIVEQHVHLLDLVNWVMGAHPVKAYGMGGRQYHTDRGGNIYDHFAVEYEYPSGVRMVSQCRQMAQTDTRIDTEFLGTSGRATLWNDARIHGVRPWAGEPEPGGPMDTQLEQNDVIRYIREGTPRNDVRTLAESSLTAIMGREAAYTGKVITWTAIAASDLSLGPEDAAAWDGIIRPVPKPGSDRA